MTEKKTQVITINDVDYDFDNLSPEQQTMIQHIGDLDRKIRSSQFNLDQLIVGKEAFASMLTNSIDATAKAIAAE